MNTPNPTAEEALKALDHIHNGVLIADEKRHASVAVVRAYIESTRQSDAGRLSPVVPMTEGALWSWIRSVMSQGACIQQDYAIGTHKTYEHYSARLDCAASERADELWARLTAPSLIVHAAPEPPK